MIYYDTNIYDLMYAGGIIKIKMRKSHSFYRVQLNVLMHAKKVVSVSYDLLPRQRDIAVELLARMNTFRCAVNITKFSGRN